MMMKTLLLALLFCAGETAQDVVETSFCDLVRKPYEYGGRRVRVRATHRFAFEASELYCLGCIDRGRVWLDASPNLSRRDAKKLTSHHSSTSNILVEGKFVTEGGPFGHSGAYRYKLVAERFLKIERVARSSYAPNALPSAIRGRVCSDEPSHKLPAER